MEWNQIEILTNLLMKQIYADPMPFWTCHWITTPFSNNGLYDFWQPGVNQIPSNRHFPNELYSPQIMSSEYYIDSQIGGNAENLSNHTRKESSREKYDFKSDAATNDVQPLLDSAVHVRMSGE
jgi:hypothetical protein